MAARSFFIRNGLQKIRESMIHGRSSIKLSVSVFRSMRKIYDVEGLSYESEIILHSA